jgi:outer membrane protein OmpA-like peptidoglycan-associated protein
VITVFTVRRVVRVGLCPLVLWLSARESMAQDTAPSLTPRRGRTTDAVIAQDHATLDTWSARTLAVRTQRPALPAYPFEKAQRWMALAREAYEGNAADPLPSDALREGVALTGALASGTVPSPTAGTQLPAYATRVRDDLWRFADSVRALPTRDLAAAELATLEMSLIRAGLVRAGVLTCTREDPERVAERAALAAVSKLAGPAPVVAQAPPRVDTVYVERRVAVATPTPPPPAPVTERPAVLTGVPANVHFGLNQDTLSEASKGVLNAAADSLLRYAAVRITLFGNTDSRGSRAYNEALSRRRANRVRDFLITRGIDGSRVTIVAQGFGNLKTKESNVVDLARNRRVDITYLADNKVIETKEGLSDLQVEAVRTPGGTTRAKRRP